MSINKPERCKTHTKEKEKSGECCRISAQEDAEQQTYEQSFLIKNVPVNTQPLPRRNNE
jgi:hypothetical protein